MADSFHFSSHGSHISFTAPARDPRCVLRRFAHSRPAGGHFLRTAALAAEAVQALEGRLNAAGVMRIRTDRGWTNTARAARGG